jgi:hypothetical protein
MEGSQQKESQRYLCVHRMPELLWYALFCANVLDSISIKTSFFHFTGLFVNHTLLWLLSCRAGEAGLPNLPWNRCAEQQGASPTTRRKEVAREDVQWQAVAQLLEYVHHNSKKKLPAKKTARRNDKPGLYSVYQAMYSSFSLRLWF